MLSGTVNAAPADQPAASIIDSIVKAMADLPRIQCLGLSRWLTTPESGIKVDVGRETWLILHPDTFNRICAQAARDAGPNDDHERIRFELRPLMGLTPVDLSRDHAAFVRIAAAIIKHVAPVEKPAPLA